MSGTWCSPVSGMGQAGYDALIQTALNCISGIEYCAGFRGRSTSRYLLLIARAKWELLITPSYQRRLGPRPSKCLKIRLTEFQPTLERRIFEVNRSFPMSNSITGEPLRNKVPQTPRQRLSLAYA